MEKIQILKVFFHLGVAVLMVGCVSRKVMEEDDAKFSDINEEYNQVVKVDPVREKTPGPAEGGSEAKTTQTPKPTKGAIVKTKTPRVKTPLNSESAVSKPDKKIQGPREPTLEDSEGFVGRRPVIDPFGIGEAVTLEVSYFKVTAGELVLGVGPMRSVNGRPAYQYYAEITSNKTFSMFYAVKNRAETFVDYDTLLPLTYSIDANESSRVKEVRTFFDHEKSEATHWEKTVKKNGQEKKKKITWAIEPYAQNMISAIYYLRNFQLQPGKKLSFRVSGEGKNYIFKGEVLRKEVLSTNLGDMNTVVVRPEFTLDDELKPTGQNLLWLTDDERKLIVKIESEVKIGKLVARVKSIKK